MVTFKLTPVQAIALSLLHLSRTARSTGCNVLEAWDGGVIYLPAKPTYYWALEKVFHMRWDNLVNIASLGLCPARYDV